MRFVYDWDETNRLSRARRWGYAGAYTGPQPPLAPTSTPLVDVHYIYDAFGGRVVKSALPSHPPGKTSCGLLCQPKTTYNVEIFYTLHLSSATWTGSDYEDDDSTETVFIPAAEARVLNDTTGAMPAAGTGPHVFFEIGDHLGSTAAIVDKASGELVERDTYQAYGAAESDYQPARWAGFHEQYRFTGKEDDSEVGLTYFGARYYSAYLGRWISPDPLTVHAMGTDLNPYVYVAGRVTAATDPSGLQTDDENPSIDASLSQYQPVLGTFFNDQTSILTTGSNDPNASSSASSDTGAEGSRGGLSPAAYPFTGTAPGPWRPSGQPVPLYIGNTIHQNIAARYVEIHEPQGETVLTNSFPIGTILRRLGLPLPIEQIPSLALRPDIANLTLRQLYEIKPANDLAGGTSQLALYLGIFADNGMPFLPGSMSDPGAMGLVPAPGGWASYYSPVPGIILYNYMRFVQRASSSALSPTTAALLAAAAAIGTYMGIRMIPVPEGEVGGPISSGAPAYAY